jgi:DNA-binding NarL/FixJ family response regulator
MPQCSDVQGLGEKLNRISVLLVGPSVGTKGAECIFRETVVEFRRCFTRRENKGTMKKVLSGMTTVLIEDYAILRVAIQHILESAINSDVKSTTISQMKEVASTFSSPVDLMLIGGTDIPENDLQTLDVAYALFSPRIVLVLYVIPDPQVIEASARLGVCGLVPKSSSPEVIQAAVGLVMAGGQCFPRPHLLPSKVMRDPSGKMKDTRALTPRQQAILKLLAQGNTMREIGVEMGISVATVKSHARTLYWKLNARNQAEATFIAIHQGLL